MTTTITDSLLDELQEAREAFAAGDNIEVGRLLDAAWITAHTGVTPVMLDRVYGKCEDCIPTPGNPLIPATVYIEWTQQVETNRPNPMGWRALNYGPDGDFYEEQRDVFACADHAVDRINTLGDQLDLIVKVGAAA